MFYITPFVGCVHLSEFQHSLYKRISVFHEYIFPYHHSPCINISPDCVYKNYCPYIPYTLFFVYYENIFEILYVPYSNILLYHVYIFSFYIAGMRELVSYNIIPYRSYSHFILLQVLPNLHGMIQDVTNILNFCLLIHRDYILRDLYLFYLLYMIYTPLDNFPSYIQNQF